MPTRESRAASGLTELEGAVLGVLHARAPCTPYQVRREFLDSPSPFWSGSAGAIYPLLRRLEGRKLVRSRPKATGRRLSRMYAPTRSGVVALRAWLRPPFAAVVVGVPADPLRTRMEFLGALSPAARTRFLLEARARVTEHLAAVNRDVARHRRAGRFYALLAAEGSRRALVARLEWLRGALRSLGPR